MIDKIYTKIIHQEQLYVTNESCEIMTVLGSCVAVCLWDEKRKIAGMNHYLLPLWNGEGLKSLKFGNISIQRLIEEMQKKGSKTSDMVAKVFGGAAINLGSAFSVGEKNIRVANDELIHCGIKIVASDVGGYNGRKVILSSVDGSVYMKLANQTCDK
ncbi:MAG: hypothetical protein RL154_1547 [Pseudomonadota bacterium]